MKTVWKFVLAVVVLAIVGTWQVYDARAQELVSNVLPPAIVFNGTVTVNGELPTYSGLRITARIDDVYESGPVTVGAIPENPFRYEHLIMMPDLYLFGTDLIGSEIEFWMNGEIKSTVTDWYAMVKPCAASNALCPTSGY